eukprot:g12389.t1
MVCSISNSDINHYTDERLRVREYSGPGGRPGPGQPTVWHRFTRRPIESAPDTVMRVTPNPVLKLFSLRPH